MKEGSIEYVVKTTAVGKVGSPEFAVEYILRIRPYNEESLDKLKDFSDELVDKELIAELVERNKRDLMKDPSQHYVKSEARQTLPEFYDEDPSIEKGQSEPLE